MLKRIIYIKNPTNLGYPKALNQGILTALGRGSSKVLVSNNDIVFFPDTIDNLLDGAKVHSAGYITAVDIDRGLKHIAPHQLFSDVLCNSCFLLKKPVVERIGHYDEAYGMGNQEDMDYIERMGRAGIERKSVSTALIKHKHGFTQGITGSNTAERLRQNRMYFEKKFSISSPWKFD